MNEIVPADVSHIDELVATVRRADLSELQACSELDLSTALLMSLALSVEAYVWLRNGAVAAVFGVAPDLDNPGVGCPWMVGSNLIREDRRFLLRKSMVYIERFNRMFPLLENYVHPDNKLSVDWLRWCGFQFGAPEPYGHKGEPFLPFFREAE